MHDQVLEVIEIIRPAIQADGGDIVLHEVDEVNARLITERSIAIDLVVRR